MFSRIMTAISGGPKEALDPALVSVVGRRAQEAGVEITQNLDKVPKLTPEQFAGFKYFANAAEGWMRLSGAPKAWGPNVDAVQGLLTYQASLVAALDRPIARNAKAALTGGEVLPMNDPLMQEMNVQYPPSTFAMRAMSDLDVAIGYLRGEITDPPPSFNASPTF